MRERDLAIMQETHQYLTIVEVAKILRVSSKSLANDITRSPSTVPPFFRKGRLVLFPSNLIPDWVTSQIVNPTCIIHAHLNSVNKKRAYSNNTNLQISFLSAKRGRPRKSEDNQGRQ
jgi:predicted DNA-binding transcriptional regulator AlpA